jgi:hypothetical protein
MLVFACCCRLLARATANRYDRMMAASNVFFAPGCETPCSLRRYGTGQSDVISNQSAELELEESVRLFARKFEATYGFEHPEFFLGTYAQACPHNRHSVAFCGRRGTLVKALRALSHAKSALSNRSRFCGHCTTSRRWRAPSKTCSPWSCICTPTTTRTQETSAGMVAPRFFARRSRHRPCWHQGLKCCILLIGRDILCNPDFIDAVRGKCVFWANSIKSSEGWKGVHSTCCRAPEAFPTVGE